MAQFGDGSTMCRQILVLHSKNTAEIKCKVTSGNSSTPLIDLAWTCLGQFINPDTIIQKLLQLHNLILSAAERRGTPVPVPRICRWESNNLNASKFHLVTILSL